MQRRHLIAALLAAAPLVAPLVAGTAAHASDGGEKKKGGGVNYIQLLPLTGTVIKGDRRRGVLTVEVGLDIPDASLRLLAETSQPRLRAAFAEVVIGYAARLAPATPPNADYLAGELQRRANLVLGRPGAKLLLGTILVS